MKDARRISIALAALFAAAVHFAKAPEHFTIATWLGALFLVDAAGFLVSGAWLLLRQANVARLGAALLGLGTALGYVLSRTTGLPGVPKLSWDGLGITVSGVEVLLAALAILGIRQAEHPSEVSVQRRAA